jgi:hypothetical protein
VVVPRVRVARQRRALVLLKGLVAQAASRLLVGAVVVVVVLVG